jgi:hypothetical protein
MRIYGTVLAVVVAMAGCIERTEVHEGPSPGVRVNDDRAPNARLNLDTVAILDKSLQDEEGGKLAVESTGGRRTATGTLEVYAVLRNRTDHRLQIEGRAQFFDDVGVPVEGPTQWRRMFLDPNSINAFKELSTRTTDVAHFYVEIREAR